MLLTLGATMTGIIGIDRKVEPASILRMAARVEAGIQQVINIESSPMPGQGSHSRRRINCNNYNSKNPGDLARMTCGDSESSNKEIASQLRTYALDGHEPPIY